jgi:lysozyme-like protein
MSLQISQLIALAAGAGFTGDDLATAVSIALAESGGNPQAYNPERAANTPVGYGSFGLWQIYLKAHPEFKGQNLFDPQLNASAAFAVYSSAGNSFRPWSTFGNGAYLAHVDTVNGIISASQDTTAATGDGGPVPGDGGMLGMAIVGALALWLAMKYFG